MPLLPHSPPVQSALAVQLALSGAAQVCVELLQTPLTHTAFATGMVHKPLCSTSDGSGLPFGRSGTHTELNASQYCCGVQSSSEAQGCVDGATQTFAVALQVED